MADETSRRYLFVAIDRATRWVFIGIYGNKTAANARRFLRDLERACPLRIRTILTDNGKEFTDCLFGLRKRAATGKHEFDTLCTELGIDHRLVRGSARSGLKRSTGSVSWTPFTPAAIASNQRYGPSHRCKQRLPGSGAVQRAYRCSIPDDHIDPRRSALFMARSVLREARDGDRTC